MANLSTTYFSDYMKERWVQPDAMQQALIVNAPLLGLLEIDTTAGGRYFHVPILERGPGGRSRTYATAKTNSDGSRTEGFQVTYVNDYQYCKLDGDVIRRTKGDLNAIEEALDHEVKGAIVNLKKNLRRGLFGNSGGSRGVVGTSSAVTTTLYLADKEDTVNFEVGNEIGVASTSGTTGSLRGSPTYVGIAAVDRSAGTLTGDANWSTITGIAAGDYIFGEGDFGADIAGLRGWIPQSTPGATAWYGVDRSTDDRLSGLRYDGQGQPYEDAIMSASGLAIQYDAQCDLAVCNPTVWSDTAKSLGADRANRVVTISDSMGITGYESIKIASQLGMVDLVADPGCQKDTIYLLDTSTWVFASVGKLVQIIDDDGLLIRRGTADDWTFEVLVSGNLCCRAPGKNVNIQIA